MELFFSIFTTVSIFIFSFKDNNKQSKTGNKKSISMVVLKLHQK